MMFAVITIMIEGKAESKTAAAKGKDTNVKIFHWFGSFAPNVVLVSILVIKRGTNSRYARNLYLFLYLSSF